MGFKKNTKSATTNTAKEFINLADFTIQNVRIMTDSLITFTLRGHGFSLYNMRLCQTKDGSKMFIAAPQQKGKDGNYYNLYAVYISDADQKTVISEVLKQAGIEDEFKGVAEDENLPFA